MKIEKTLQGMRSARSSISGDSTVGFVPTMGGLHAGHLSLISRCRSECDVCIVSIFVNSAQFAPTEDLDQYPRTESEDLRQCAQLGTDILFAPESGEVYPESFGTWVRTEVGSPERNASSEGSSRSTFFRGVATVLTKLFVLMRADKVYFGQKDAQQSAVVRQLVRDMWFDTEVVTAPTVREADGLAMSTRNAYLGAGERELAPVLYRTLQMGVEVVRGGVRDADRVRLVVRERLEGAVKDAQRRGVDAKLVYVSVCERESMREVEGEMKVGDGEGFLICVAMMVGKARLIDNVVLDEMEL